MRHRHILTMFMVMLLLLSACGFGADTPDADLISDVTPDAAAGATAAPAAATAIPNATTGSEGVVTIGFGAQEFERQVYEPLITAFNEQNPGIRVQFVSLDEFTRPESGQAFDPGRMTRQIVSAADTASLFFVRPDDMKGGLFHDLTPLIEADPEFNRDDFYPNMLESGSLDGRVFMLPQSVYIQLLSYNKELWAARGLPAPAPDWTWDDLLAAAEQLAQKRGDEVEVYGLVDWSGAFAVMVNELSKAGVNVFTTPSDQLRLDTPEAVAALERVAALVQSGAVYRSADSAMAVGPDQFRELITQQRAGMWLRDMLFNGPDEQPTVEFGTAAYPPLPVPSFGGTQGYVMSSGTQHPDAAWRWLSFLSKQEIKPPFDGPDATNQLPARKSIAERSGYWSKLDEEAAAVVRAVVERPPSSVTMANFDNNLYTLLDQAISKVASGELSAEQALTEAQSALDQRIAQAQSTPSPTPAVAEPIVVATPVAEVAPEGATKIVFGAPGFGAEEVRRAAREFNQQNQGVFVEVKNVEPTVGPFRFSDLAGPSDCFTWFGPPSAEEITNTLDLQPLIDADTSLRLDDYPPAILTPFRHGDGLYGLPYAVRLRVLSYNQTAFDDAGLSYPDASWTMDDFIDAAQKLTGGEGQDQRYGYAAMGSQIQDLIFFLDRFGVSPVKGGGDTVEPNFTDEKLIQAVRAYMDMLKNSSPHKELAGYTTGGFGGPEIFELVNSGRVGMWFDYGDMFFIGGGGSDTPAYTKAIAPPPLGDSPVSPDDLDTRGLFISSKTQHAQACWEWLKYLSTNVSGLQGAFPARISVAESEAFASEAPAGSTEVYQAYREALGRTGGEQREPFFRSQLDYFWFFRAVDRALQGEDLERELADAQDLSNQFLACVRADAEASVCAKQVDPNYEGWNSQQN